MKLPNPTGSTPNSDLINAIFCLFSDNLTCTRNWSRCLFDSKFNDEPELRNKIGTIWFVSLLDSLEGEKRSLDSYKSEAVSRGLTHLIPVCEQAQQFFRIIESVLSLFSREEQIFLRDIRDQAVHSWLARRHTQEFQIQYFNGTEIVREKIRQEDFNRIVQPFYMSGPLDTTLAMLIKRFLDLKLKYWLVMEEIHSSLHLLQEAMVNGCVFNFETLSV